jgi:hypothetical protein
MNPTMIARSVALLALALQLLPAVLPALCDDLRRNQPRGCDQPMSQTSGGLALTAQQTQSPCLNAAFCGIAQAATPSFVVSVVSVSEGMERAPLPPPGVHAIDAPTPLPPPPEA